jgi:hypothetical protein
LRIWIHGLVSLVAIFWHLLYVSGSGIQHHFVTVRDWKNSDPGKTSCIHKSVLDPSSDPDSHVFCLLDPDQDTSLIKQKNLTKKPWFLLISFEHFIFEKWYLHDVLGHVCWQRWCRIARKSQVAWKEPSSHQPPSSLCAGSAKGIS